MIDERGRRAAQVDADGCGPLFKELQLLEESGEDAAELLHVTCRRLGDERGDEGDGGFDEKVVLPHPDSKPFVRDRAVSRLQQEPVVDHPVPEGLEAASWSEQKDAAIHL